MSEHSRRSFVSASLAAIGGSTLFAGFPNEARALETALPSDNPEAYWQLVARQFALEPGLQYFNNASLGPSPRMVADATEAYRRTLDSFPSRYMWGGWKENLEAVRSKAAALFSVDAEEIALIHNTTEGMNLVASSLDLAPGDEVIVADHEHPSGTAPWQYWQECKGVKLVRPTLPILPGSSGEIIDVYRQAMTSRTRVISMCHMINTNGMILPVKEVAELAHERGILVVVDGAQSAGMLHFDLRELGCDYYATSSHKWLYSPKGVGVFYARKDVQDLLRPLIVASGWDNISIRRLENYNTRNLPEVLGLGAALDFHQLIGPERKQRRIFQLKHHLLAQLQGDDSFQIKTPGDDQFSCGIVTVEVRGLGVKKAAELLAERHHIDCRPMSSHELNGLRLSVSTFNTLEDVDYLVSGLRDLCGDATA